MGSISSKRLIPVTMAAKEFVNDAIAHNHIVVFSKTDCGYCKMTKEVKIIFSLIIDLKSIIDVYIYNC